MFVFHCLLQPVFWAKHWWVYNKLFYTTFAKWSPYLFFSSLYNLLYSSTSTNFKELVSVLKLLCSLQRASFFRSWFSIHVNESFLSESIEQSDVLDQRVILKMYMNKYSTNKTLIILFYSLFCNQWKLYWKNNTLT